MKTNIYITEYILIFDEKNRMGPGDTEATNVRYATSNALYDIRMGPAFR